MNQSSISTWIQNLLKGHDDLFLLGINGPQGAGKSTLSNSLCALLAEVGIQATAISIDDFYLSRAEQVQLAEQNPGNPYLQQRGYPGTHDIALGLRTLKALKHLGTGAVTVPRYDKSAYQGNGDRTPQSEWTRILGPLHLIILEGWMLGFNPVDEKSLPNQDFKIINQRLDEYRLWTDQLDGFIQLQADDYRHVLEWRVEAEEKMKATGKSGMSKEEISKYIELFLPAYATYLPTLTEKSLSGRPFLRVPIGKHRLPR